MLKRNNLEKQLLVSSIDSILVYCIPLRVYSCRQEMLKVNKKAQKMPSLDDMIRSHYQKKTPEDLFDFLFC
ncbi:hypothetical protein OJAV_G00042440 [Oryzias javanicus]|uniref:Uncharacterized protein n=1 Tax=Oryzias javanicus TaxID=123683 RepID=A0A437DC34_ORYJA|nr:hypothetical protein OJAV_G00042440 [Oryzias javanicus]